MACSVTVRFCWSRPWLHVVSCAVQADWSFTACSSTFRLAGLRLDRYRPHEDTWRRLVLACQRRNCETMLDIGANSGQFAVDLRSNGYSGRIISFEPLSSAHSDLRRAAANDPKWTVADRLAIGDRDGETEINIAANSHSSSLLEMLPRHQASAPDSAYVGRETIRIARLDSYMHDHGLLTSDRFAVKVDTQGFEAAVLDGAPETLSKTDVVVIELSLVPLYTGAPSFRALYERMDDLGFRCISLDSAFADLDTGEMLQVDAVFARDHGLIDD